MPTTTKQPLEEMSAADLQAALEITQSNIAADEREYSSLHGRMIAAAEDGLSEEWQRLHGLHNTLPTKINGQKLRLLSIKILLKEKQLEEAQSAKVTTGVPIAELRAKAESARKEFDDAMNSQADAIVHANQIKSDLANLKYERADLQAQAAKPTMPQGKPLLRAA